MRDERVNWFSKLVTVLAYTFILAPMIIIVIISFNSGEAIQFPPSGVSLRWYEYIVTTARRTSLRDSETALR